MKARKQEVIQYTVQWIEGSMMYFRAYKRDTPAVRFMDYLVSVGVNPAQIKIKAS